MTTDAAAQLAILADALTKIVDLATGGEKKVWAPPREVLARVGDIAAEALAVAAALRALAAVGGGLRDAGRRGEFRRDGALTVC